MEIKGTYRLTVEQRTLLVQWRDAFKSVMSIQTVQEKKVIIVQNHPILSGNAIRKIMKNIKVLSNVLNKNKGLSGRLGHSALKPIFSSVSVRVPKVTFQSGGHIQHVFFIGNS